MIPDIKELNFPKKDGKQYATLTQATVNVADMGEKNITTQVKIDGEIIPDFSHDWAVEFQGEKYIMPLRIPQGAKENTSLNSTIDLTFQHWAIYQLKRWPFVTIQQIAAGTYLPDEEVATVSLNLKDFCILFGQVLEYYYGGTITIDLNPAWQYKQEATIITISHTKIWNVLIDAFHDKYGVRWEIKAASGNSNTVKGGERYVIRVGYPTTEVDHIFEYGFEGGLLKVERQVQSEEIRNMLKGRGGETNMPFRYFKNTDPNNPDFRPDPDWVEELANIYFPNLMPATFRSYVQGWKAAHINQTDADGKKIYAGYTPVGEDNAYAPWAYRKGYTDTKFAPVEFVADEITINPTTDDKQVEILPGYSPYVKNGSSLDKYGPLPDTLDNNDDIYPTLQGTGLDIAVEVEQIESDDVAESTENDAKISNIKGATTTVEIKEMTTKRTITVEFPPFDVPDGQTANIVTGAYSKKAHYTYAYVGGDNDVTDLLVISDSPEIIAVNALTGAERSAVRIPAGRWKWKAVFKVELVLDPNVHLPKEGWITVGYESPKLQTASLQDDKWRNTFDIWVKNIWDSTRLSGETDTQYAERVWKPVLGDRESNTAKVVFTSGALGVSEDYEFTIVDFPVPDTSKTWEEKNEQGGVIATHTSHWRITLAKSDAELEATGLYVPSTQKQGKAGDRFVFIGTEMTHVPYVVDAEVRQADWLKDQLGEVREIKPTAVVTTDRVRLNNEGKPNALINQLHVGNSLRLFDKRFFNEEGKAYETLYLQSITYTYREPTKDDAALNPDVQIVLGDEYTTSANPVSMMQSEINALQRQVGSISNIEQIVRAVGDRLYLRKDGISDRSLSPTQFFSLLTSGDFRAGLVGGAGWGFFKDENGNWVLEADRVNVRQEMSVNTLVINQAEGRGGMEIDTAAYIDGVTRVVETDDGYVCYFDQKGGSVANLFHVDDIAYCNRWTAENAELKFYKRRVTAVSADSITLSKTDVNGTGIPAEGDNIIHFGNYTDTTRQYVKVRDVVGGGYERYIEALNSVNAAGVEYYFVGKQAGQSRWFVGNKDLVPYSGAGDGSYIEYINRKFNLNNVSLSVNTTIGDDSLEDYIKKVSPPVKQEDIEGFVNAIVDPKLEGIQNQIDGVIETWFYNGVPTLTNYPASGWITEALKIAHLGDLYYDNDTGTAYRFSQNADGGYYWNTITDDAITKALAAAQKAQDTADGKRRIFTSQPTPPYDKGDLWVNATYPAGNTAKDPSAGKYHNDILRCNTSRATGSFAIGDWELASNYTDDAKANEALTKIAGYEYLKNALLPENPTQITGGLIMSTLVSLGYTDSAGLRHTMAGMNGSWVDSLGGRTIGSWWGGPMVDLYDKNGIKQNLAAGSYATSLVRMDGSFYFANGNIGGRNDGSGWLAGDNITWDRSGAITFGNGIKIDLGGGENTTLGGLQNSIASVDVLLNKFANLFTPYLGTQQKTWADVSTAADFDNVRLNAGLWSTGFLSAHGQNGQSGTGTAGKSYLSDLLDVQLDALAEDQVLVYRDGKWTNDALTLPDMAGYALESWVIANYQPKGDYLTKHQAIHALTIQKNGTDVGTYDPSASAKTINIADVASAATLSSHIGNTTAHITAAERTKWNKVVTDFAAITGADSDTIINKWEEVVAFLDTYTEADTLANLLGNKVDKVIGMGLSHNDFTDALLNKLNGIEAGANKYVLPTASASVKGGVKVGSGLTIASEVLAVNLSASHIPALAISKITGLQAALDSKLNKSTFDELFEKVNIGTASAPVYAIKAKFGLYSDSFLTAHGINGGAGAGAAGKSYLKDLLDVDLGTLSSGQVLAWNGTKWVNSALTLPDMAGYALESWVEANYVTLNTAQTITGVKTFMKDVCLGAEMAFQAYQPRKKESVHGWAKDHFRVVDYTGTTFVRFGAFGEGNQLKYIYIGSGDYNEVNNLRISDVGVVTAAGFVKYGGTSSQFLKADGSVDSNSYALSSALTAYVKKSGDTMTGLLSISTAFNGPLNLNTTTASEIGMRFLINSADKGWAGYHPTYGTNLFNYHCGKYLAINDSGVPNLSGSTIWHAGNDGSGSGLDADLLDGLHASSFARGGQSAATVPSGAEKWVRVAVASICEFSGIISLVNNYHYFPASVVSFVVYGGYRSANNLSISQIGGRASFFKKARIVFPTASDAPYYIEVLVTALSGANPFEIRIANACNLTPVSTYTAGSVPSGYSTKEITLTNGMVADDFHGSLSGNAASASRLQTTGTYTAWGQTYFANGVPQNVNGDITGVANIIADYYFLANGSTNPYLRLNLNSKYWYVQAFNDKLFVGAGIASSMQIDSTGNVGIGLASTTNPTAKLDVAGLVKASSGVQIGATADYGWYNYNSRLCAGNSTARGVNVGSLLVSGAWADATKVPTHGIYAAGEIISYNPNAFRAVWGNYGAIIRNDGGSLYFLLTDSGEQYGNFNSLRPLYINLATGLVNMNEGVKIGGCTISWDSAHNMLKFDKGLYSEGGVSAHGINTNAGGSGGGGKNYLSELLDVQLGTPADGQILTYRNNKWVNEAITQPSLEGYALESWVETTFVSYDEFEDNSKAFMQTNGSNADNSCLPNLQRKLPAMPIVPDANDLMLLFTGNGGYTTSFDKVWQYCKSQADGRYLSPDGDGATEFTLYHMMQPCTMGSAIEDNDKFFAGGDKEAEGVIYNASDFWTYIKSKMGLAFTVDGDNVAIGCQPGKLTLNGVTINAGSAVTCNSLTTQGMTAFDVTIGGPNANCVKIKYQGKTYTLQLAKLISAGYLTA